MTKQINNHLNICTDSVWSCINNNHPAEISSKCKMALRRFFFVLVLLFFSTVDWKVIIEVHFCCKTRLVRIIFSSTTEKYILIALGESCLKVF